jgi:hypothetical protein
MISLSLKITTPNFHLSKTNFEYHKNLFDFIHIADGIRI